MVKVIVLTLLAIIGFKVNAHEFFSAVIKKEDRFCDVDVNQETGYFDLNTGDKHYFYWLFESRGSPEKDPLVLWLNGGPGCSSELGLFTENGPCSVNEKGTGTIRNKHAWNNNANLLFVDQPAGTGFSYGTGLDNTEVEVGQDFYDFLTQFFAAHPSYIGRKFYITGESYGGHYVPAIAHAVWKKNKKLSKSDSSYINLQGIGIGNGLTDASIQYKYYADMIISDNHHEPAASKFTYGLMKAATPVCIGLIKLCQRDVPGSCIAAIETCNLSLMLPYQTSGRNVYDMRLPCYTPPLCNDYSNLEHFLNNETIQEKMGIRRKEDDFEDESVYLRSEEKRSLGRVWKECNQEVNIYFSLTGDGIKSTAMYVSDLLNDDVRVVVYAGDQDYICNWLGNQALANELEWKKKGVFSAADLKPWLVAGKEKGQIKTVDNFTFLRVYDAGHMVPQDQPEAALSLLNDLLLGSAEERFQNIFYTTES